MSEINPKIEYCDNQRASTSSKTVATCSSVQYNKINTGGNDPTISKKMQYAQYIRTSKSQTGFLR